MRTTKQLFLAIVLTLLLFSTTTILAQDDAPKGQEFMTVTTNHWNMDKEDFK